MAHLPETSQHLTERLQVVAQGRSEVDVAHLRFVGLDELERLSGRRWPRIRDDLFGRARAYLNANLKASDVLIEGVNGFFIIPAGASNAQLAFTAFDLARGLGIRCAGDDGAIGVYPSFFAAQTAAFDEAGLSRADSHSDEHWLADALEWRFQPYWDRQQEAVVMSCIHPHLQGDRAPAPGYRFDAVVHRPDYAALDEASLRLCEATLRRRPIGKSGRLGACVHVSSVADQTTRSRLIDIVSEFDPRLMRRRFVKIAAVPPGYPSLCLAETLGALKPHLPNLVVAISCEEPDIAGILRVGASAVGFTLSRREASGAAMPESELLARIAAGVKAAHVANRPFFVDGGIGPRLATRIIALGVDYIAAPAVWPPGIEPAPISRWPVAQLAEAA